MDVQQMAFTHLLCIIASVSFLFYLLMSYWKNRHLHACAAKIGGPLALPLIGSAYYFVGGRKAIYRQLWKILDQYKPLSKIWLGPHLLIITARLEDIDVLLNNHIDKGELYDFTEPLIANGLLTESVENWKRHRKTMNLTFNQRILNSFVDIFSRQVARSLEAFDGLRGKGEVQILPILFQINFNTICETVMGLKPDTLKAQSEYISWTMRMSDLIGSRLFQPWLYPEFIWKMSSAGKEVEMLREKTWGFVRQVVEMKRCEESIGEKENGRSFCFLDHLRRLTHSYDQWTQEELIAETQTLMFTGSGSLAVVEQYILLMLAMHPEIQEKVYQELFAVFGDSNRSVTCKDLSQLDYLGRVIKETMRLFPVAPYITRFVREDVILDSYVIPKGSFAVIPIMYLHRHPQLWSNPLTFDPDRFLPAEVADRNRYAYMPFSHGPRNCIGLKYAEMTMKCSLSTILRFYKVTSANFKTLAEIEFEFSFVLKVTEEVRLKVEKR